MKLILLTVTVLEGALALYFLAKSAKWEARCKSCEKHFKMTDLMSYIVWSENWKDFERITAEEKKEFKIK